MSSRPDAEALAHHLAQVYGRKVAPAEVRALAGDLYTKQVADATHKYLVPAPAGAAAFMILSGRGNPRMVARAVAKIQGARARLDALAAAPVVAPLLDGEIDGLSYAIWPLGRPISAKRVTHKLQTLMLLAPVGAWVQAICAQSRTRPTTMDSFSVPLERVAADGEFPAAMRREAHAARERLETGAWAPWHCIQHGDLWPGNIVFPNALRPWRFWVVDWSGARIEAGYPIFDFYRYARDFPLPRARAVRQLRALCAVLECAPRDALGYQLAAMGAMGAALEEFPEEKFRKMAEHSHGFLSRLIAP